ncbi:MAG: cation diffusion facilitator family transporter [Candidatus Hinthialibacter antarcticus]|nr:cation diffusion facilitator family transporter [Candidatus Hinthialibacter antarcticus]
MDQHSQSEFSYTGSVEGRAMLLSLFMAVIIIFIKGAAYFQSGSLAIFSDFIESAIQLPVIVFAAYSLSLKHRPPDENHLYGHGKIQFISAALEGGLVIAAAMLIWYETGVAIAHGYELDDMKLAAVFSIIAAGLNGFVGWYLIRTGKRVNSFILIADGKHILSDFVTTAATLTGAVCAWLTGWIVLDTLAAILAGAYILTVGLKLVRQSVGGLLDEADSDVDRIVRKVLKVESEEHSWDYHALRHRSEGDKHWVELHLVFKPDVSLDEAHDEASHLEDELRQALDQPVTVTTHLEPEGKEADKDPHAEIKETPS